MPSQEDKKWELEKKWWKQEKEKRQQERQQVFVFVFVFSFVFVFVVTLVFIFVCLHLYLYLVGRGEKTRRREERKPEQGRIWIWQKCPWERRRYDWLGQQHQMVHHVHKLAPAHGEISGNPNVETSLPYICIWFCVCFCVFICVCNRVCNFTVLVSFSKLRYRLPHSKDDLWLSQVVDPYSRVMIDWAYKNAGLQSSTGFPDVTVRWNGKEKLMCGGETLIVDQETSRVLLPRS